MPIWMVVATMFALSTLGQAQSVADPTAPSRAAAFVQELRQFQAALPAGARSDGRPDPIEERRRDVYEELRKLGPASIPALVDGMADADVRIRRNVAFLLNGAAGTWNKSLEPKLDIRGCLPSLIAALKDPDARVRELAAQAIGTIGPDATSAVPALIGLLGNAEEGSRISALIGLTGIGRPAHETLPAIRKALSDPSAVVRRFAQEAISTIESQ